MDNNLKSKGEIPLLRRLFLPKNLLGLLCFSFLTVNAYSYAQVVSLNKDKITVRDALVNVSKQANLDLVLDRNAFEGIQPISVHLENVEVNAALNELLKDQPLSYSKTSSAIVIKKKEKNVLGDKSEAVKVSTTLLQEFQVNGEVRDENNELLPGVSVRVKNTNLGTTTDLNGRFSLMIADKGAILSFSFIGFVTQEVMVGENKVININLKEDLSSLDEVVVVGYGTQRKANLTGSVDQVSSEVLENRPLSNLNQGLQGVLPNVNISFGDGKPTGSSTINIRGATSIGQGGSALILIDGIEGDPSMLNPNDVASVSVLKDAASAAIYGARGSFGVVLITTKLPKGDSFSVNYSMNHSIKKPTVLPNYVTDGFLWATMFNESFYNWEGTLPQAVNKTLPFSPEYLAELERRSKDPSLPKVEVGPDGKYVYYENTDWYNLLYKNQLSANEHNLSVSRSTDKADLMLSGRYFGQDGLFRYNSDDFKTYNLRGKGSLELYPWLRVNNNFSVSNREYFNPLNVGEGGGIWRNLADEGHPLAPMLNPDGTLTHSAAYTVGDFYYGKNGIESKRRVVQNTIGFQAKALEDKIEVIGNYTFQNMNNDQLTRRVQVPYSTSPGLIEYLGSQYNDLESVKSQKYYNAANLYGSYENVFNEKHQIKAMVGGNYEESTFQRTMVQRNGLIFEDAKDLNLALGQSINTGGGYEKWRIFGVFSRLNYAFDNKYLLEVNGRYDGSSKFPEDESYGFFPSFSAGWRVSQEDFWKVPFISEFKLRGSYGSLGNGNIASYAFQDTYSISRSDRILQGLLSPKTSRPSVLPDGLTWETATTINVGMDLEMFSSKLQFTGDLYNRKTTNMYTIGMTLPAVFGATSPRGNYSDMETKGWELSMRWRDQVALGSSFLNYNIGFNLADNKSKILKYNNPDKFLNDYYEGMKMGEIWGYVTEGFFTSQEDIDRHADQSRFLSTSKGVYFPGDIKFKDLNGDGVITPGDNTVFDSGDRVIIGNSSPRYTYGITLGADWKKFFFSAFFQGVGKRDWYPLYESNVFWGQYNRPYGDIPQWHLKSGMIWSPENPDSFFPRYVSRLANRAGGVLREPQSKYIMDASYIRLKNLQVGYTFTEDVLSKLKSVKSLRVYVSGENLWTRSPLYKILDNVDVENAVSPSDQLFTSSNSGDGYNYPMQKSVTFGLSVTF